MRYKKGDRVTVTFAADNGKRNGSVIEVIFDCSEIAILFDDSTSDELDGYQYWKDPRTEWWYEVNNLFMEEGAVKIERRSNEARVEKGNETQESET